MIDPENPPTAADISSILPGTTIGDLCSKAELEADCSDDQVDLCAKETKLSKQPMCQTVDACSCKVYGI
jgi:hypothetical protein